MQDVRPEAFHLGRLPVIGDELVAKLVEAGFTKNLEVQQVLCVAEEAGEFVGAYRRWSGMARRPGPFSDVEEELADVVITSFVMASVLEINLSAAMERKLEKIHTRGWRAEA
jgi:NTP pyrophosphatase (non-canonical NTP hydrolase)